MGVSESSSMAHIVEINSLSAAALFIQMISYKAVLGCGTAFYYKRGNKLFLVSNWHNFSGRDPITKEIKSRVAATPDKIRVHGHAPSDLAIIQEVIFDLIDADGSALWYEHPVVGSLVDVGVLPIPNEIEVRDIDILSAINKVDPLDKWPLKVGEQLLHLVFLFACLMQISFLSGKQLFLPASLALIKKVYR